MQNTTIAFVGAGNMAKAIIGGLINTGFPAEKLVASTRQQDNCNALQQGLGIQTSTDNSAIISRADVIVLGVKPQQLQQVCAEIKTAVMDKKPLIISIAAGITVDLLEKWLSPELAIIRCMPNTPSLVRCGASGVYANQQCTADDKTIAETLFNAVGITRWVDKEPLLDAVTAVSGSGPAYFFLVMQAITDAGIKLGLDAKTAKELTLQTALGAATMAQQADVDTDELRRRVTSPGGTTAAALAVFEQQQLLDTFTDALQAADARSKSLAQDMA